MIKNTLSYYDDSTGMINEYKMTSATQDLIEFINKVENTELQEYTHNAVSNERVYRPLKKNEIKNMEDLKVFFLGLVNQKFINLEPIVRLFDSNDRMCTPQVWNIVNEFLNLYSYEKQVSFDFGTHLQIARQVYKYNEEDAFLLDDSVLAANTLALDIMKFNPGEKAKVKKYL